MTNDRQYTWRHRIADGFAMFVVMWVSLLCLIYVAFGEASRTYERFQGDKLAGQVQIVQNAMETFLRSGLPLSQFVGFNTLADRILASDSTISSLAVYDLSGAAEFSSGDAKLVSTMPAPSFLSHSEMPSATGEREVITIRAGYDLETLKDNYRIAIPLRDKFETVGGLAITMPTAAVEVFVWERFETILMLSFGPAFFFAGVIALFGRTLQGARIPWPQITFSIIFVASASFVIATLISLYSQGAQTKAQALAESLGQRLSDLVEFNLNLNEIEGLDTTFNEYLHVNPDLSSAALTVDGKTIIHTDETLVGTEWRANDQNYQYVVDLTPDTDLRDVKVAVELPSNVVFAEIVRSVKNFGALFIASAFLAHLFFQVGGNVRRSSEQSLVMPENQNQDGLLDYVKPVFFLGVLAEHLTYAFLPQHVKAVAMASAVPESLATAPFWVFYLFFALTLIPSGYAAQRISPRPLMYCGLLLAGLGMAGMAVADDFWLMVSARGLSGIGQGMLFIGVQTYLLAVSSSQNKTQAAAVIVYGFQGGMISGMAVGSLLVGSMGRDGVFALGALIVTVAAIYAMATVPPLTRDAMKRISAGAPSNPLRQVRRALCDSEFINAMISIGMPAKAVLTGVVSFALPLLLAQAMYPQEDIGQIIMVYALAVVASSQFISPLVDRAGDARMVLFKGTALSGVGLLIAGYVGLNEVAITAAYGSAAATGALVLGIAMVGVAHGFINAPVVTFVANSRLAGEIGAGTATSTYRFLERLGHVAGPVLVGQLFLMFADDWSAIIVIGAAIILLGLVFVASSRRGSNAVAAA